MLKYISMLLASSVLAMPPQAPPVVPMPPQAPLVEEANVQAGILRRLADWPTGGSTWGGLRVEWLAVRATVPQAVIRHVEVELPEMRTREPDELISTQLKRAVRRVFTKAEKMLAVCTCPATGRLDCTCAKGKCECGNGCLCFGKMGCTDVSALPQQFPLDLPAGAQKFEPSKWTQAISVTNDRDTIDRVPVSGTRRKWHQSGGMEGIKGVVSEKYRLVPGTIKEYIESINVWNGSNYQPNRGLVREYPDGSRFDDVLSYAGKVFEHRVRTKVGKDAWQSDVIYSDRDARPPGYVGLTVSCANCHDRAGKGRPEADGRSTYATGLPPGGDTVLSDPLPWHLVGRNAEPRQVEREEPREQYYQPQFSGRRRGRR